MSETSTAVAIAPPGPGPEILADDEINRLWRMAQFLAKGAMFKDVAGGPEKAFSKMLIGYYLGLNPAQAMLNLHLVRGNVQFAYPFFATLIRSHAGYDYKILEHTAERAEVEFTRDDVSLGTAKFSVEDATKAGIVKDDGGWKTYPENMCVARALSKGCRFFMGEVLGGIPVYALGETPAAEDLAIGEGDGEARGIELRPEVEATIAKAEELGHPGWAERSAWEMHQDRGPEYLAAKLVMADDDLKALAAKKAAAEEIQDADVVDPDVPIDADGLPESPRTHTMSEDGFISSIPSLGEAASEAKEPGDKEQADPGSVLSSESTRSEPPAQDPTSVAPVAGGDTPVSVPTASKTSDAKPPVEVDSGTPQPETSTSASYIEYLAAPGKNELLFRHQDCGARWTIALEDEHLPLREQDGVQCPTCKQTLSVRPSAQEEKRVKKLTKSAPTQEVSELDRLRAERKAYAELPADGEDEVAEKEQLLNSIDRKIAALEAAGNPNQESMEV